MRFEWKLDQAVNVSEDRIENPGRFKTDGESIPSGRVSRFCGTRRASWCGQRESERRGFPILTRRARRARSGKWIARALLECCTHACIWGYSAQWVQKRIGSDLRRFGTQMDSMFNQSAETLIRGLKRVLLPDMGRWFASSQRFQRIMRKKKRTHP